VIRPLISALLATVLLAGAVPGQPAPVSDIPMQWYLAAVRRKVAERWEGRALQGRQPVVTFEIGRDGAVSNVVISESSGNSYYDRIAMRTVTEAAPFPRLPDEFPGPSLRLHFGFSVSEDRGVVTPLATSGAVAESDAEECAKREQIAASISTVESKKAPGQQPENTLAEIEKRISQLQPIVLGTCPENLGIAALTARLEKARQPIRRAIAHERRRQEINAKPWPERIKRTVLEERIEIGMTSEQVTASWGRPQSINETITAASRHEQWVYPGPTYLHFINGTLTTIQRRR
jgi:periplasmic protein TonB